MKSPNPLAQLRQRLMQALHTADGEVQNQQTDETPGTDTSAAETTPPPPPDWEALKLQLAAAEAGLELARSREAAVLNVLNEMLPGQGLQVDAPTLANPQGIRVAAEMRRLWKGSQMAASTKL
jgi:hypothetical protein